MSGPRPGGATGGAPGGPSGGAASGMGRPGPGGPGPRRGPGMMGMSMGTGEKSKNFRASFGRLLGRLRPEAPLIVLVIGLAVVSVFFAILGPKILGDATNVIFDGVIGQQIPAGVTQEQAIAGLRASGQTQLADMLASMTVTPGQGVDFAALARILALLTGVYLLSSIFSWGQAWIMTGVTQRTVYRLRRDVDEKLARLPLRYFDSHARGDLLSRVTNDIDNIGQTLQQSLTQLITSLLTVIGVLIMMFTISPILAVISLLSVPVSIAVTVVIAGRSQKEFVAQWATTGTLNGHVEEMHTGHAIVKLFGRQEEAIERFAEENDKLYEASYRAQFISGIIQPALNFIANLNYVAIAVIGGLRVASGQMSLGDVIAFISYSRQFSFPIIQTASIANVLQSAAASAERVFELLDEAEEIPDPVGAAPAAGSAWGRDIRGRVVPIRARRAAHRAPRPHRRRRRDGRNRRADRRRQDDARQPADAVLRRRRRSDNGRWGRHARPDARRPAPHLRDGAPGHLAVPRHHPREHRVRPRGRHRGRDRGRGRSRPRRPLRADTPRRATTRSSTTTQRASRPARSSC